MRTQNQAFARTYTFRMKYTQSFINETPDLCIKTRSVNAATAGSCSNSVHWSMRIKCRFFPYLCALHKSHSILHKVTQSSCSSEDDPRAWCTADRPVEPRTRNSRNASCASAAPPPLCTHLQRWSTKREIHSNQTWVLMITFYVTDLKQGFWVLVTYRKCNANRMKVDFS